MQGPGEFGVITPRIVIISGPNGGEFVYNTTRTVLLSSNVGAPATSDPVLGISCPQGIATYNSHGKVLNLLSTNPTALGFFQYQDSGAVQGPLILAVSSMSGTDPVVGTGFPAGLYGVDPAFGDTINTVGANITLTQIGFTRAANVGAFPSGGAFGPSIAVTSPEMAGALTPSHSVMDMRGASATRNAQVIFAAATGSVGIVPVSNAAVECQFGGFGRANTAAPASFAGYAEDFASGGFLDYVAGATGDTDTYNTGTKTSWSTAVQTFTSTTPANITGMVRAVAAGTYRISGIINGLQGGGTFPTVVGFTGPATSLVFLKTNSYAAVNGATAEPQQPQILTALGSVTTIAFPTPDAFVFEFDGIITFSAAGTFAVTGAQGSAGHNWSSQPGSFLDLMPKA